MGLTQPFLQETLLYDPIAGSFTWKIRPQTHFSTARGWNVFNAAYAGMPAGHLSAEGYCCKLLHRTYRVNRPFEPVRQEHC